MYNNSAVEGLEAQLKEAKQRVKNKDLAIKLEKIPEFRDLIIEGYMKSEVVRNCEISGDIALSPAQRADALAMAQAGGHLNRFLSAQIGMGTAAEREIVSLEEDLALARAEEAND